MSVVGRWRVCGGRWCAVLRYNRRQRLIRNYSKYTVVIRSVVPTGQNQKTLLLSVFSENRCWVDKFCFVWIWSRRCCCCCCCCCLSVNLGARKKMKIPGWSDFQFHPVYTRRRYSDVSFLLFRKKNNKQRITERVRKWNVKRFWLLSDNAVARLIVCLDVNYCVSGLEFFLLFLIKMYNLNNNASAVSVWFGARINYWNVRDVSLKCIN